MITIRKGQPKDVEAAFNLIKELAEYEKAPHEVTTTVEQMLEDGFGNHPVYQMLVAVAGETVVGIAIYFTKYSTWKGKGIYLDDIVVSENWRGQGVGSLLFKALIEEAKNNHCRQLHWQVLNWNEPAIHFYKKFETQFDGEWINCKMTL